MIRRISLTGEAEQLAQLYYNAYRAQCAEHTQRKGHTVIYICHNEKDHAHFTGIARSLGLNTLEDKNITPAWTVVEQAILEDPDLSRGAPFTCPDIQELTGIPRPYRAVEELVRQGFLTKSGKARGHRYRRAGVHDQ